MKYIIKILILIILPLTLFGQNGNSLDDGAIVYRPVKDVKYLFHYGVMYNKKVIHFNQNGLHISTMYEFADGCDSVKVWKRGLVGEDYKKFKLRVNKVISEYKLAKYDALNNNCEHFAMYMVYGVKKSIQSDVVKSCISDYWPSARKQILKNPKSAAYVDLMDTLIAKNFR